jgi:hypothetical protein
MSSSRRAFREFVQDKELGPVLSEIAESIRIANHADPDKWGLRINQSDLMLKVGFVEVLQAGDGWLHFLVKQDLVAKRLRTDRRYAFSKESPYKNAPGCISCDVKVSYASQAYRTLRSAHEAALRIAAKSRRHTTTIKDHSPEFVRFLAQSIGVQLPQPSYYAANAATKRGTATKTSPHQIFEEGAVNQVLMNRYERDPAARRQCIMHYGALCVACGLNLEDRYGPDVSGLIHVHHVAPLANVGRPSITDPVRDLRPVCPNCHAVIHSVNPPRTIDQVKRMIRLAHAGR